jgi:hypothetical protein
MDVDWGTYVPFDPGISAPLHEVPRGDARAAFERLMRLKDERKQDILALLLRNGVRFDGSGESIDDVEQWFRRNVEPHQTDAGRLGNIWYAVATDLGVLLGDHIRRRAPNLVWRFYDKGSKDISYQRPVIMGFTKVRNPKYNLDPAILIAQYGQRVTAGDRVEEGEFRRWVEHAIATA